MLIKEIYLIFFEKILKIICPILWQLKFNRYSANLPVNIFIFSEKAFSTSCVVIRTSFVSLLNLIFYNYTAHWQWQSCHAKHFIINLFIYDLCSTFYYHELRNLLFWGFRTKLKFFELKNNSRYIKFVQKLL